MFTQKGAGNVQTAVSKVLRKGLTALGENWPCNRTQAELLNQKSPTDSSSETQS